MLNDGKKHYKKSNFQKDKNLSVGVDLIYLRRLYCHDLKLGVSVDHELICLRIVNN